MSFLLTIFLFFLIYIAVSIALMVWRVRKQLRSFRKNMEQNMNGAYGGANGTYGNNGNGGRRKMHRTADGVTIVDDRPAAEANKKIFAPDEGEYVDYTEV